MSGRSSKRLLGSLCSHCTILSGVMYWGRWLFFFFNLSSRGGKHSAICVISASVLLSGITSVLILYPTCWECCSDVFIEGWWIRGSTQGTPSHQTEGTGSALLELRKSKQVTGTESYSWVEKKAQNLKALGVFGAHCFKKGVELLWIVKFRLDFLHGGGTKWQWKNGTEFQWMELWNI